MTHAGATPAEWAHFTLLCGLTSDLLPVVSDQAVKISPQSKMAGLGKTPSIVNSSGFAAGIPAWTQLTTTEADVARWQRDARLGICLQTRSVRAIDVDIEDAAEAERVWGIINEHVPGLARRVRGSNKFLVAFALPGEFTKRIIRTAHGIVEFLASGQQFIAAGVHPSGKRYQWVPHLPAFAAVPVEQFESLWAALGVAVGVAPAVEASSTDRHRVAADAARSDHTGQFLLDQGWVKSTERDGRLHIRCPWEREHTAGSTESATSYFPAHTGGYEQGHFRCLHAHCEGRSDQEFRDAIGMPPEALDDFEPIAPGAPARFHVHTTAEFLERPVPTWLVQGVLPEAQLAVVFGESGSGKSFWAFDLVAAIARGVPWRDRKVKQGKVVYVAAEGAGGMRNRLAAYLERHAPEQLDVGLVADAPNLMALADVQALLNAIRAFGNPSVIVLDTFAQVMPGANENSGEDVGKALGHCKQLSQRTGAMVMLIHHSGKDATKGARGWSGLRAAADVEIEIVRSDDVRAAVVSKQKDGEDGAEFGFRLGTVQVGADAEGNAISSCVVEHAEGGRPQRAAGRAKLGTVEKIAHEVVSAACELGGAAVPLDVAIDGVVDRMVFDPAAGKRDQRRKSALRAIQALLDSGILAKEGARLCVAA